MKKNIVQIDLGAIDEEIANLYNRIELLQNTKKYAQSVAINSNVIDAEHIIDVSQNMGVSDFINSFLKNKDKIDTKVIINAYAEYVKKGYNDVSGNVSNALSRLKKAGIINNEEKSGGRRAGSLWFLI